MIPSKGFKYSTISAGSAQKAPSIKQPLNVIGFMNSVVFLGQRSTTRLSSKDYPALCITPVLFPLHVGLSMLVIILAGTLLNGVGMLLVILTTPLPMALNALSRAFKSYRLSGSFMIVTSFAENSKVMRIFNHRYNICCN